MPDITEPIKLPSLTDLIDNNGINLPPKAPEQQQQQQQTPEQIAAATAAAAEEARKLAEQQLQKTPEQIAEEARVAQEATDATAAAAAAATSDEELTVEQFFGQVDSLRGDDLSKHIDYGQVDPMSAEGFVIRDQFIEQQARLALEEDIKTSDPRAYAYLLHRQNGGSDDEFFTTKSFVLPELDKLKDSVDLQRNVLTESFKAKGIPEKQIQVLLKSSIDSGELLSDAEAAYKEIQGRDTKIADEASKRHADRIKQERADIGALDSIVNKVITEGKELKFQIPAADQSKFAQAFKENIHYENGNFFLIRPLNKDNLSKLMEAELFAYLGGDLGKMIQKAAATSSASKFITKIKTAQEADKIHQQQQASTSKTLSEI